MNPVKKELICFIHIEKAAGTTLHHILANSFKNYLTISPTFYWSNELGNNTSARELAWMMRFTLPTQAIGGHPLRTFLGYEKSLKRPMAYITFLREPVSRYLSHFKHQKFAKGIEWNIHSFLAEKRFNDYMTRRLSPDNNLEEAKRILREDMKFTGLMENFDESLLLLKNEFNVTQFIPYYEKENVSSAGISDADILKDPDVYQQIILNNQNDIALYNYAVEMIYPAYKKRYTGDLSEDVKAFRNKNKNFLFSQGQRKVNRLYRVLYYKPLQFLIKFLLH